LLRKRFGIVGPVTDNGRDHASSEPSVRFKPSLITWSLLRTPLARRGRDLVLEPMPVDDPAFG
jgi:hypothetical protein